MDWIPVVLALGVLGVVGLIFGILLEVADKKLAVEVDPRISKVGEALGGANCGACGYAGCAALAEAIVSGEAKPNACPAANMAAISEALGITVEEGEKMVARVICQGHNGVAKERYKYDGYTSCAHGRRPQGMRICVHRPGRLYARLQLRRNKHEQRHRQHRPQCLRCLRQLRKGLPPQRHKNNPRGDQGSCALPQ